MMNTMPKIEVDLHPTGEGVRAVADWIEEGPVMNRVRNWEPGQNVKAILGDE